MVLMIDNYDSFTYNVVDLLRRTGEDVIVKRNRSITLEKIEEMHPDYIVISPGPGTPDDAGISLDVVHRFAGKIPILGICLGHQVIVQAFGGVIGQAPTIMHGKTDAVIHDGQGLFRNIEQNVKTVRYHSLSASQDTLPDVLQVTARGQSDQAIMGVRHNEYLVEGVQFHPESFETAQGMKIIRNFLQYKRGESPVTAILGKLTSGEDLEAGEAYEIMDEITNGELTHGQIGAFLGAMAVKGVTPVELSQFAAVLLEKTGVPSGRKEMLDTCGTGGDGKHTFNISTASSLVCAAAGVKVAKHGNKAVSSKSGSYDFLKALGIPVGNSYDACLESIDENNFAFFFAPLFHSAMKYVGQVRQELKVRTVFNMIGPLVNPAQPAYQVAGVFSSSLLDIYAETLKLLGSRRVLVVHSDDHLDEISICAPTEYREVTEDGEIASGKIYPSELGIAGFSLEDLEGGNASENASIFRSVITGKDESLLSRRQLAALEAVALNAGAGLYITGMADSIASGYRLARVILVDGTAAELLGQLTK